METNNLPKISILVPARNEEKTLLRLFNGLSALNYPYQNLEILLGNDNSSDRTGELMDEYAKAKDWVKVIHLKENISSHLKGKTRVLDVLIEASSGSYLFFTDADIELPSQWIHGMLRELTDVGVVVGVTGFRTDSLLATMQGTEWLMALSIFKIAADWGWPSTGLGNNMAVNRAAYDKIGGYKTIGFSIIEDYYLYSKIIEAGFGFKHAFHNDIVAYTLPPENYFEQRNRWIKGGLESKPTAMLGGILQALSLPIFIILGFIGPKVLLGIVGFQIITYYLLVLYFQYKLNVKGYLSKLPAFILYMPVAWFLQFLYFLFRKNTIWKERTY